MGIFPLHQFPICQFSFGQLMLTKWGIDEVGADKLGICGYLPLCQFKGMVIVVGRVCSNGN